MINIFEIIKRKKGVLFLIIGIILGIILLLVDTQGTASSLSTENTELTSDDYINSLEKKTEDMINKIKGVSEAKVMITLKNSGEQVFALDSTETNKKHVVVDNGLVCINELVPEIEGVAVVCNGGDNAIIKQKVTELLCSLLGIYSTHIYITE